MGPSDETGVPIATGVHVRGATSPFGGVTMGLGSVQMGFGDVMGPQEHLFMLCLVSKVG